MPSFNCMQCGLSFANPNDYMGSKHACMANAKTIPVVDAAGRLRARLLEAGYNTRKVA